MPTATVRSTPTESFTDLDEAFRDDDETGRYAAGEDFFDFDNDGVRSPGDTCSTACCARQYVGELRQPQHRHRPAEPDHPVGQHARRDLSTSCRGRQRSRAEPGVAIQRIRSFLVVNGDVNGNIMPGGTTVGALGQWRRPERGAPTSFYRALCRRRRSPNARASVPGRNSRSRSLRVPPPGTSVVTLTVTRSGHGATAPYRTSSTSPSTLTRQQRRRLKAAALGRPLCL